ncbi:11S globulin seed storage protein Ana o 2.0101-like [Castanea sativa]|uniref:11S globulin seed storage protein Ana o 2.0101-like n=1 Tax=Castanea sativa TaxID=21020 RepID=UPI003F64ECEC
MAYSYLLSLSICFLVLYGCFAQIEQVTRRTRLPHQHRFQTECRLDNLNAQEPSERIESEAGFTEYWDQNDDQFQCAGVALVRHTIQRRGLLLPSYSNAPRVYYVAQGKGIQGAVLPGCPNTYQSPLQFGNRRTQQRIEDSHQKLRPIREGDILAVPEGVAQWIYNDGENQLVLVGFYDTLNEENQLDQNPRDFYLAGNPQEQSEQRNQGQSRRGKQDDNGNNVFGGFDRRLLVDSLNIREDLADKIQSRRKDQRGNIVDVQDDLQLIAPGREDDEEREDKRDEEREDRRRQGRRENGIEETFCTQRLKHNTDDPQLADFYNPRAGRVTTLNSYVFPILERLQLTVVRGFLYKNALVGPYYNLNSNSVIYGLRGNARIQVVDDNGDNVYYGELRKGQALVVPQNYVVLKRAENEGFEWVSIKTNDNAITNQLAGRLSVIQALPVDMLQNAFNIDENDAFQLKENRNEAGVFSPSESQSQRRRD